MNPGSDRFADRRDAGRRLAENIKRFKASDPVIVAVPRGGVPVAYEVAKALGAPLDLIFARKVSAPGQPEYGLGAVVDYDDPQLVLDPQALREINPPPDHLEAERDKRLREIARYRRLYLAGRPPVPTQGRVVLLVDDGVATGGTVRAALQALRRGGTAQVILCVPVASEQALASLAKEADEVICLCVPSPFYAVSCHYDRFEQTTDEEVVELLGEAATFGATRRPPPHRPQPP